jgi:hypothetical protein
MSDGIEIIVTRRSDELKKRLKRFNLVFVPCGANFSILREPLLVNLGGAVRIAATFATSVDDPDIGSLLILTEIEKFAQNGKFGGGTLGQIRQKVGKFLEAGSMVCLLSSQPRIAYRSVPGSSIIEDSAVCFLQALDDDECAPDAIIAGVLPSFGLKHRSDLAGLLYDAISELGVGMLAALDHAIFEAGLGRDFLRLLEPREIEALQGAGFVKISEEKTEFTTPQCFVEFTEAVAAVLAGVVSPQDELASISEGIWLIERTVRAKLRQLAIQQFAGRWKKNLLHGDLQLKVVGRARIEANVTALNISDLRDPIEWLSLGELLEVVQGIKFNGFGLDELFWRRFKYDILPIRNRLSHMRLIKKGDRETVAMWVARIKSVIQV